MLDDNESQMQEVHLREQHRDKLSSTALDAFITRLCASHTIPPRPHWAIYENDIGRRASIFQKWKIVNIVDADNPTSLLFSDMLESDYKNRGVTGDYVFTSLIENIEIEKGLVKTRNSLYCLDGEGEEVNATLLEASKMKAIKKSLNMVR